MDKMMTVPEVAEYLKMSKSKLYLLIQRRQIPHVRIGRNVRIRERDLQDWIEEQAEKTDPLGRWR